MDKQQNSLLPSRQCRLDRERLPGLWIKAAHCDRSGLNRTFQPGCKRSRCPATDIFENDDSDVIEHGIDQPVTEGAAALWPRGRSRRTHQGKLELALRPACARWTNRFIRVNPSVHAVSFDQHHSALTGRDVD
jgi:hypothetical protein